MSRATILPPAPVWHRKLVVRCALGFLAGVALACTACAAASKCHYGGVSTIPPMPILDCNDSDGGPKRR
jgi:hypothetical protein